MKNKSQISREVKEVLVMVSRFLGETKEFYETQARFIARLQQLLPKPDKDFNYSFAERSIVGAKDRWLTIGQAASRVYVSPSTVSRWAKDGYIVTNGRAGREKRVLLSEVLLMDRIKNELADEYEARQKRFADGKLTDHDNK
jgi:hypothetical protein